jgi:BirA family biotin operon repressor/biotin-[acetyl-CoA-carboxylase] ligase
MKSNYDIIWLNSVDSTNDEAKRRIPELDNLAVLSAVSQTKGRGQRSNTWLSEPGKNLLMSIVLKYAPHGESTSASLAVQAYDQQVISQITSLALVDLLAAHEIEAKIKWPNDIYVGNKKICGILIENTVLGKWMTSSIIGIGLNVNQRSFDAKLPNPTSMVLCSDGNEEDFNIEDLLDEFMGIFIEYINRFCHITGGYNRLDKLYTSQLLKKE